MLNFGQITKTNDNKKPFTGEINSRILRGKIAFLPIPKRGDNSPSYKVLLDGFEAGAAWSKAKKETAEEFFTITIDTPEMAEPLNLTAWADDKIAGQYNLVWQRTRQDGQSPKNKSSQPVDTGDDEKAA